MPAIAPRPDRPRYKTMTDRVDDDTTSEQRGSSYRSTKRHLRGSSLLFIGRLLSLVANFGVQILTVRYLSKSDYGALAYALAVVSMGISVAILGLHRAVPRFVPIYQEDDDHNSAFGTIVLAIGTVLGIGLSLVALIFGLQGFLTERVANDPLSIALLLIVIGMAPMGALTNLFRDMLAIFANPRSIFFCRHVLGPCIKLAAILIVILAHGNVQMLAYCLLIGGFAALIIHIAVLYRVMNNRGIFHRYHFKTIRIPLREIFRFSIPLLSHDAFLIIKTTVAVMLLEYFRGTTDVAEFRAVAPIAGLCLVVLQSLKSLYTPIASRLFARNETDGINDLYWQSAIWITLITFPVFAVCFFLSEQVTVLLFGSRYSEAAILLAILSIGTFFNAVLGLNTYTLQVFAKVRFITWMNVIAAITALILNLWLIPLYGALGAAIATSGAVIAHNLLIHAGLLLGTGVDVFNLRYLKVYGTVLISILGLFLVNTVYTPTTFIAIVLLASVSLILFVVNRNALSIGSTFPEILRVPILGRLLGVHSNA